MTKSIELEAAVADRAEELARQRGISVSELVSALLTGNSPDEGVAKRISALQRIKELTKGISLPPEVDARRDYNEHALRKHA
jgi:macrodomain Ter protein organizer (MatP/YcbG family)